MNNAIIVPEAGTGSEITEKINPFDKLVSNDQLSYLPNLYLRQYRLIDELARLRHDFPEQRLLMPRPRTAWDAVLEDAKFASRMMQERRKLRLAGATQIARQSKNEVQRTQLRAEEQYHFHRLTSGCLAEAVAEQFRSAQGTRTEEKTEPKVESRPPRKNNDIFMDEDNDYGFDLPEEEDFFNDLLEGGQPEPQRPEDHLPQLVIEPLGSYLADKYQDRKETLDLEPQLVVSRKGSLRRINECVRKRLRFKEEEEETVGRSLSSATVSLSTLLNTLEESKAKRLIEPTSFSSCLFPEEKAARKRRDEDPGELRWSPEEIERMEQRNQRGSAKKLKFDAGVLMMAVGRDDEDFKKVFEKQILSDKRFPPSLRNVAAAEPVRRPKYYNQFHDESYQLFVMKHNKARLFEKFAQKAGMIFPENYSHDDVEDAENISAGRLFIYKPQKLMERVVFLKEERQVKASLRSQPKAPIDEPRALLLAFLVEKYLRQFGNNWRNIAQLICRHVAFSNRHVTVEFVQEIYQMVVRLAENGRTPVMELWDKRVLPYDHWPTQNYSIFEAQPPLSNGLSHTPSPKTSSPKEEDVPITPAYYSSLLEEEVEETDTSSSQQLEAEFREFLGPVAANLGKLRTSVEEDRLIESIGRVLDSFAGQEKAVPYLGDSTLEMSRDVRNQILSQSLKGEIKVAVPFRKKKSINERNNELVKILQALRNRNPNPTQQPVAKKPDPVPVPPSKPQPAPVHQKPLQAPDKKPLKSPEKPGKHLGAPSRNKKNKDGEDKK